MKRRQLCKFKENCKNFKAGEDCPYSHDRCRDGDNCPNKQNCMFYHEPSGTSSAKRGFNQPMNEVQCKFGPKCNKLAEGKCFFKHTSTSNRQPSSQKSQMQCRFGSRCNKRAEGKCTFKHSQQGQNKVGNSNSFSVPKSQQECKFRQRCNLFLLGKCQFKHSQAISPAQHQSNPVNNKQQKSSSKSFRQALGTICCQFLHNREQNEECGRLHEYTLSKTIRKIYQVDNAKITKAVIYQPRNQDEQPIYVLLMERKIIFGQLINLARESGMEHINNNSMVLKRCFHQDICLPNQHIEQFYLTYSLSEDYPRQDILVIKATTNIHVCLINKGKMQSFPIAKLILGVIFINNCLFIQLADHSKLFFKFDPNALLFTSAENPIKHNFSCCGRSGTRLFGSEIGYGILQDNSSVCFMNQNMQVQSVKFEQKVKDLILIEHDGSPLALVLTQRQLFAVNLLTFQKKSILEAQLQHGIEFTSLNHTLSHLFLSINGWGILIYSMNSLESPSGALCLGQREWKMQSDQRGNLSVLSSETSGYTSWWVFKVRRH